jgi:hypothetical protein
MPFPCGRKFPCSKETSNYINKIHQMFYICGKHIEKICSVCGRHLNRSISLVEIGRDMGERKIMPTYGWFTLTDILVMINQSYIKLVHI